MAKKRPLVVGSKNLFIEPVLSISLHFSAVLFIPSFNGGEFVFIPFLTWDSLLEVHRFLPIQRIRHSQRCASRLALHLLVVNL